MRCLFTIVFLVFFMGCSGIDKPKKPSNLIPENKMAKVMHDLYILNAAKGVNRKVLELNGVSPLEYVFKKYDIDSLQFAQSNTYYAYDLKTYKAIVEKVKVELEAEKEIYDEDSPKRKPVEKSDGSANKKAKDTLKVLKKSSAN